MGFYLTLAGLALSSPSFRNGWHLGSFSSLSIMKFGFSILNDFDEPEFAYSCIEF